MTSKKIATLLAAALLSAACSGKDDTASAAPPDGGTKGATKTATKGGGGSPNGNGGGGGGGGGQPGAGGQRPQPSITLATTDIALVKRGNIEEGVAITGDLRPIESVTIRARLEGDLVNVNVREGQKVSAGQVLARFEDSEQASAVASAKADKLAAESDLTTSKWNLDQTSDLFKAGAVSERDFKLAQQSVATASARLAAADARVKGTSSVLSDTRAVAPTSGVISARSIENGEHISRGATLFTLVRTDVLELAAAVPARFAGVVKVGQTVLFGADGKRFEGKVARVSPIVDPVTRTVTVYVQVPNETDAIKGGTFAAGRVVSRTISRTLVIPVSAVRIAGDGQQFVYRLAGKAVDVANIQVGATDERVGMVEVLDGLTENERIIIGNVGTLGRGMTVIIAGEEQPGGRPGRNGTQTKQ